MTNEIPQKVQDVLNAFTLPLHRYKKFMQILEMKMNEGLKTVTHDSAEVKMYPSYVTKLPTGREEGQFLALDLGGTSFRVWLVTLTPNQKKPVTIKNEYEILPEIKCGTGEKLFQFIAQMLMDFIKRHPVEKYPVKLGFTFSFPCDQQKLNEATLVRWTKGFSATGCEGENVSELLQRQIDNLMLDVKCVAVVNDAVGTLLACALEYPKCRVAVIVGTGTNASYVEDIGLVEKFKGDKTGLDLVVINTEWGALGDNQSLEDFQTDFDIILDIQSSNRNQQIFEKMCSGKYLWELVRITLVELIEMNLLFLGEVPQALQTGSENLTTGLSNIERDLDDQYELTRTFITGDLQITNFTDLDAIIIKKVCEAITGRAAGLLGAATACLINRFKETEITVAIDGSVLEFHPKIAQKMELMINNLKRVDAKISILPCKGGSGIGAGVIAALSDQMN